MPLPNCFLFYLSTSVKRSLRWNSPLSYILCLLGSSFVFIDLIFVVIISSSIWFYDSVSVFILILAVWKRFPQIEVKYISSPLSPTWLCRSTVSWTMVLVCFISTCIHFITSIFCVCVCRSTYSIFITCNLFSPTLCIRMFSIRLVPVGYTSSWLSHYCSTVGSNTHIITVDAVPPFLLNSVVSI